MRLSHILRRLLQLPVFTTVAVLTLATSSGVTSHRPPNALRTYDVTDAIHSSLLVPIGTITSA